MKDINDFKNKIKNQDELMGLGEVKSLIKEPTPGFFSASWTKTGILAIALLGIVSVVFWLWPKDTNEDKITVVENRTNGDTTFQIQELNSSSNLRVNTDNHTLESNGNSIARVKRKNQTQESISNTDFSDELKEKTQESSPNSNKNLNSVLENSQPEMKNSEPIAQNLKPRTQNSELTTRDHPQSESFYYDNWQQETQSFTINPAKSNVIKGKEGTIVIIPSNAVCGNYETFSSEIQLQEYYKKEDMLRGQLTTMSHGEMLESAGMVNLTAMATGKELKLCKDITILFPSKNYEDSTYVGFSGVWDDEHNNVDWTQLSGVNFNFFGGVAFPNCERPRYQAIRCKWDVRKAELKEKGKSNLRKDYRNDEVIRRIRRRFWFQDSVPSKLYDEVYDGIKYKMKDTMSASAYHACRIARENAMALQNILDSVRGDEQFDPNLLNANTGYILAQVSNLGPINCDRFTQYENTKNYTYKIGESDGEVSSRLIFRDIKSILSGTTNKDGTIKFTKIPSGQRATLLVLKYLNDEIHLAYNEITIGKEPTLHFEKIEKSELANVLGDIAEGKTPIYGKNNITTTSNEKGYWQNFADSIGAIYLTDEQLEEFDLYSHDDVILFSVTKDSSSFEIYSTYSGRSGFSRTGNQKVLSSHFPTAMITKGKTLYGVNKTNILKDSSNNYFSILTPYKNQSKAYRLWYFKKTQNHLEKIPSSINVADYNSKNSKIITDSRLYFPRDKSTKTQNNIYNSQQMISINNELLAKLHITQSATELLYCSNPDNNSILFEEKNTNISYGNNETLPKPNDYPPAFFTSKSHPNWPISVTEFESMNKENLNSEQYFYANKHNMLSLPLKKPSGIEVVFWYEDTASVLKLLSPSEKTKNKKFLSLTRALDIPISESKNIDKDELNLEKMAKFKKLSSLSINPIRLTPTQLAKLNIAVLDGDIHFTQYSNDYAYRFKFTKKYTVTNFEKLDDKKQYSKIRPKFISDKYGKSYRMRTGLKVHNLNRLIPIYVGTDKGYRLSDFINDFFHPDCIFWYEPTTEFLALLPDDIREQLTYELSLLVPQEHELLTTESDSIDNEPKKQCVYLDPCSDIKTNLQELKLFPNPTTGDVNIKVSATASVSGTVSVNNLAGQEMKSLDLSDIRLGGKLDISDLPAGIYLATLLTDDGDKITRRVIRE